jgi:hypothetical protein
MLTVVFQGIESQTHLETLRSALELFDEPPRVSAGISFKSLRSRRLGPAYVKGVARDFPVVMEPGFDSTSMTEEESVRSANEYYEFLHKAPITAAIEFRHSSMVTMVPAIPASMEPMVIPLWETEDPMDLERILTKTGSVACGPSAVADKRVPAIMRRSTDDAALGVRMLLNHPDLLDAKRAGFNAVLQGSWIHAGRFGDVMVWTGTSFLRVNKIRKKEMFDLHGDTIQRAGLDMDLLRSNDARESNKLAAYSYISWAQSLSEAPLSSDSETPVELAEVVTLRTGSDKTVGKGVKNVRPTVALPIFTQETTEAMEDGPDGVMTMRSRSLLRASSETIRACDSCFLASTCPAFEPASSCAFNFPVEVRTDAQVKALLNSIMELQATRVAFARFAEEVNGGYPDEVVGREMDRLFRMAEKLKKVEEKRERLTVSVESESSGGGTGVLSRIFGERASVEQAPAAAISADIVVAEIVED